MATPPADRVGTSNGYEQNRGPHSLPCHRRPPSCGHAQCLHSFVTECNKEPDVVKIILLVQRWLNRRSLHLKTPKHNSCLSGRQWMDELWDGNNHRFFEQFRMRKDAMAHLIYLLCDRYGFVQFKKVGIDESLGIFLMIIGHAQTWPIVCERFQHSGQTIHAHFHEMLEAVCRMGEDIIRHTDTYLEDAAEHIRHDPRYWPHFRDCIGAVDGTHIEVNVSGPEMYKWINRKGVTSTNVLVACDFNMAITYAKVGFEGSMHDARVLKEAIRATKFPFKLPPHGKYYVADAGYANAEGFLTPYKGVRYHLDEYRHQPVLRNGKEEFNYLHSSIRTVIERTFGIVKERWRILRQMTNFALVDQINIIWACFALHNYLRRHDEGDLNMLGVLEDESNSNSNHNEGHATGSNVETPIDSRYMNRIRDEIRDSIRYANSH